MPFLIHAIKWEINIIAIDHVINIKQEKYFLLLLRHDIYTMWTRGNLFWGKQIVLPLRMSPKKVWLMAYGDSRHFQKYFSYIVVVSFIGGRNRSTKRNHRPVASHWQTLSHNVISSTPRQLLVLIGAYCTVTCHPSSHFHNWNN